MMVDSGATHHCVRSRKLITGDFVSGATPITVANGKTVMAVGKGTAVLRVRTEKASSQLGAHSWRPDCASGDK